MKALNPRLPFHYTNSRCWRRDEFRFWPRAFARSEVQTTPPRIWTRIHFLRWYTFHHASPSIYIYIYIYLEIYAYELIASYLGLNADLGTKLENAQRAMFIIKLGETFLKVWFIKKSPKKFNKKNIIQINVRTSEWLWQINNLDGVSAFDTRWLVSAYKK